MPGCTVPVCRRPCQNGGTCVQPDECQCLLGFEGEACETEQTPLGPPAGAGDDNATSNDSFNSTDIMGTMDVMGNPDLTGELDLNDTNTKLNLTDMISSLNFTGKPTFMDTLDEILTQQPALSSSLTLADVLTRQNISSLPSAFASVRLVDIVKDRAMAEMLGIPEGVSFTEVVKPEGGTPTQKPSWEELCAAKRPTAPPNATLETR